MSLLNHLQKIPGLLRSLAELRVQGKSWETVAGEVKQPLAEVRAFVDSQESEYLHQLKKARAEQRRLCYDTAVEKLREQTQSANEKISHSAANMLARIKMAEDRALERKKKAKQPPKPVATVPTPQPIIEKVVSPIVDKLAATAIIRKNIDLNGLMPTIHEMTDRMTSEMVLATGSKQKQSKPGVSAGLR